MGFNSGFKGLMNIRIQKYHVKTNAGVTKEESDFDQILRDNQQERESRYSLFCEITDVTGKHIGFNFNDKEIN